MAAGQMASSGGMVGWIRRNQLTAFVILTYALSWWAWVWYRADPENVGAPILPIGPLLAVLLVLALAGGWPAIRELLGRIGRWRVGLIWYVVVLLLPVALTLTAVGLNMRLGAERVAEFTMPGVGELLLRFLIVCAWIGLGEEPGWRGFALPRLLAGHRALSAALILGLIHMVWHAPLFGVEYDWSNVVPWGITVICFSIVTCWMHLHTEGSVLMPILMHGSNNTIALVWRMFEGPDQIRLWWIWCALWMLTTLAVVAFAGPGLTRQRSSATA